MKKKVLLINPRKGWRPALGLLYVASYLREAGHLVKVAEFVDEDYFTKKNDRIWKDIFDFEPDIIGLGVISWNRKVAEGIITKLRKRWPDRCIVAGGKDPTFKPEVYFNFGVNFVVMHEGERTLVDLIEHYGKDFDPHAIKGLAFKYYDKLIVNEMREPLDMGNLLFPAFDLIDYKQYCNIRLGGIPGHFIKTGFIMANRGCPYRCRFCTDTVRHIYRERSIENIITEIKWQMKNWKINGMVFLDDLFYYREERVREFCERIIDEKIKLKFYAQTRVDRISNHVGLLELMKRAGFIQLAIGVESGSQRMLDIMNKKTNLEQIRNAIERINQSGIYSYAFLIVGFPEEQREDLQMTARFLEEIKPTFVAVNYFMPMPGTEYYNDVDTEMSEQLSFSLTEKQTKFSSNLSAKEIIHFRNLFTALGQRSADKNLLRYPSFYLWVSSFFIVHAFLVLKTLWRQRKYKKHANYYEAIRTTLINQRIYS